MHFKLILLFLYLKFIIFFYKPQQVERNPNTGECILSRFQLNALKILWKFWSLLKKIYFKPIDFLADFEKEEGGVDKKYSTKILKSTLRRYLTFPTFPKEREREKKAQAKAPSPK